jgi:hypothetical protein
MASDAASPLHALESALRALKLQHRGALRLTKLTPGAPFPLAVAHDVPAPPAAESYDLAGALCLRVVLQNADLGSAAATSRVELTLPGAPRALVAAARDRCAARWAELAGAAGAGRVGAALSALFTWASSNYIALLTLLPELLEPYLVPDAHDRTARRFAFAADASDAPQDADAQESAPAAPAAPPLPVPTPPHPPHALAPALAAELAQAARRYDTLRWSALPDGGAALSVDITPLDPQWRQASHLPRHVCVRGTVPGAYPNAAAMLEVECAALHPRVAARVASALKEEAGWLAARRQGNALRALLAFVSDHAGALAVAALDAAAAATSARSSSSSGSGDDASDARDARAQSGSEDSADDDVGAFRPSAGAVDAGGGSGAASNALSLTLQELLLDGIAALEPAAVTLACACARCGGAGIEAAWRADASSSADDTADGPSGACAACGLRWRLRLRARLAHGRSGRVALLQAEGCRPLELLLLDVIIACEGCGGAAALRGAAPGRRAERACARCHARMALSFSVVAFPAASSGGAAATAAAAAAAASRRRRSGPRTTAAPPGAGASASPGARGGLTVGQPLPSLGACAHYAHSHRWLRFPCCGRLFPCDTCHELAAGGTERCAPGAWASKMVCGFCSKEQAAAGVDGKCVACGRRICGAAGVAAAARAGAQFWEGGAGCRDRSRLSRVRVGRKCCALLRWLQC